MLAWRAIAGDRAGGADVSPYVAPARATNLSGVPPSFIVVGELDVFRHEAVAYAMRLIEGGVPTELHLYPGAYHAWDLFAPGSALAVALRWNWYDYLARGFPRYPLTRLFARFTDVRESLKSLGDGEHWTARARTLERLREVGENIGLVLDTDREPQ